MTVTQIRPTATEQTPESQELLRLDTEIQRLESALLDPHGWGDMIAANLADLRAARADLVALTVTAALAA